jgi:hypothetical protein
LSGELSIINNLVTTLGAPGLLVICMLAPTIIMAFMYMDHRRAERSRLMAMQIETDREIKHREDISGFREMVMRMMVDQEKRFEAVVRNYENNVILVQNYEKLANDLAGVIHLSTQAMTKLVDRIDGRLLKGD